MVQQSVNTVYEGLKLHACLLFSFFFLLHHSHFVIPRTCPLRVAGGTRTLRGQEAYRVRKATKPCKTAG